MQAYNWQAEITMTGERRSFQRQSEDQRREALITAALDLIAARGPEAATVRAIAERAGVTPGLIRHYFASKQDLTRAAYRALMDRMTEANTAVLDAAPKSPEARLAGFIAASLRPPVMHPAALRLWAGFIHRVRDDAAMREVHETTYLNYRNILQGLITALPGTRSLPQRRSLAIACNGVIDGLWLEGSALPEVFGPDELARIGVAAVGAILQIDLMAHLPSPEDQRMTA